jgi:hypothetical protein
VFGTEPGAFDVMIGSSSADIQLKAIIEPEKLNTEISFN